MLADRTGVVVLARCDMIAWLPEWCFSQDLSIWSRLRRGPVLLRCLRWSLPDPLPRGGSIRTCLELLCGTTPIGRRPSEGTQSPCHRSRAIHVVIGVDTRAATQSEALVTATTGAVIAQVVFAKAAPGLDPALTWITQDRRGPSIRSRFRRCGLGPTRGRCRVAGRRTLGDARCAASRDLQDRCVAGRPDDEAGVCDGVIGWFCFGRRT